MGLANKRLSTEEQELLVSLLMKQEYAIELISSELNDIESGQKAVDMETYRQLTTLYDRIRFD
ncbi:antirepressor AbbA [Bacillus sp. FJAT-42376]|uniref:antirepressor AbbA n=1 Tax=Bacillus sp. FJAT-42376 TaxID=2014076 RepID=UPI000F4E38D0|nr:antirepressor AbbA [Bacillus sp. FJAT-42376]AZB42632.1 antirepressor AbbA [Bacillus sp. FJAT-42376]